MVSKRLVENQLGAKLLEKLKKIYATSLLTLLPIKLRLLKVLKSKKIMSFLMVKLLMSTCQDSWPQRLFSIQVSSRREMKLQVCTLWLLVLLKNVILILEKTFMQTSFFLEELLFTQASQIDLRKNSMPCVHNKTWSKSLPLPIDTTQYGLVVPLFHPSQPSKPNGSPRMNTKKTVLKSSIENVYE